MKRQNVAKDLTPVVKNNLIVLIIFLLINAFVVFEAGISYGGFAKNMLYVLIFLCGELFGFMLFNSIKGCYEK